MTDHDKSDDSKRTTAPGAENLLRHASQWRGAAPVDKWDPPYCGEMDMRIAADGNWHHEGTVIQRQALVQLFSSILRREADGHYYLVTPAEKVRIQVDDCPFTAVLMNVVSQGTDAQVLRFTLNTGEIVEAGPDNPIRVEYPDGEHPHPVIDVRHGLRALISRSVFYELVALAALDEPPGESLEAAPDKGSGHSLSVLSHGELFILGRF